MRSTIGFRMCIWGEREQRDRRWQGSHPLHTANLMPSFQVFQTFSMSLLPRQKVHTPGPAEKPTSQAGGSLCDTSYFSVLMKAVGARLQVEINLRTS